MPEGKSPTHELLIRGKAVHLSIFSAEENKSGGWERRNCCWEEVGECGKRKFVN